MAVNEDHTWRTPAFRQSVVTKIDEAIRQSGMPTARNSMEMESHVFNKAKTKEEYLGFVARLILHVREMNSKKAAMGGAGAGPVMQGVAGMPDPINALQTLARQGTANHMVVMGGQPPGQGPPGMGPQQQQQQQQMPPGMMLGMGGGPGIPTGPPMGQQQQPQMPPGMMQGQPQQQQQPQQPPMSASGLLQSLGQRPGQGMSNMSGIPNKIPIGMPMGAMKKLMELVQERPVLWNKQVPGYMKRRPVNVAWMSVAAAFNHKFTKDQLRKSWESMKDAHMTAYRKYMKKRRRDPATPKPPGFNSWAWIHAELKISEDTKIVVKMEDFLPGYSDSDGNIGISSVSEDDDSTTQDYSEKDIAAAKSVIESIEEETTSSVDKKPDTLETDSSDIDTESVTSDPCHPDTPPRKKAKVLTKIAPKQPLHIKDKNLYYFVKETLQSVLPVPSSTAKKHEDHPHFAFVLYMMKEMELMTPEQVKKFKRVVTSSVYDLME